MIISESLSTKCIFPVCRGSTASGVDSIKVDRTFVMFPSFRMLSQSFYQWADHRDRETGEVRGVERKSIQQAREMFLQPSAVGLWTKNSLLKRVLCILAQTLFVGFALFSFPKCTLIICSALCVIFQGGWGKLGKLWIRRTNCVYHSFNTFTLCYKSSWLNNDSCESSLAIPSFSCPSLSFLSSRSKLKMQNKA